MDTTMGTRHQAAYDVLGDYETFIDGVNFEIARSGISFRDLAQADHLCYRTTSAENYAEMQERMAPIANLLGETAVAGRPISTFRLHDAIRYGMWRIDAVELPAPKPNNTHPEGLEHVEFVIYDDLPTFMDRYAHLDFETKSAERGINPELGLQLGEYAVKFHMLSLSTVLYLEKKLAIDSVG